MTVSSFLSFLLFTMLVVGIHGFPSMLTDGRMGCMTDLSTDEVIMNNPVVPFSDSPHPDIALGWKHVVGGGGGDEGQTMQTGKEIVIKEVPFSLRFYLVVPPESGVRDVQYVVETTVQPGVYFEEGGCDDKRRVGGKVFGDRGNVWHVEQMPTKPIEIWAGWATGHEAVKLTDKIIVTAAASNGAASNGAATDTTTKGETGVMENAPEEGSEEVDREVENMVEEVMELEEAEETERQAMEQELGDDDDSTMTEDEKKQGKAGDDGFSMEMMQRVLKDKMALVEEAQRMSDKKKHHLEGMKKWRERLEEKPQLHQDLVREGRAHQMTDEQLEHVTAKLEKLNLAKKTRKTNDDNKDGNKDGEGAAFSSGKAWDAFHGHQRQRHPQHRLDRNQPNFGGFNLQDRETYLKKIEQDHELRKKRELYAQKEQKLDNEKIRDLFRQQTKFMMEQQQQDQDPQKQQPPQKMLRQQLNQQVLHKQMQEEMQKHQEGKEVVASDSQKKKKGTVDNNNNNINQHKSVMASDEMYKMRDLDFGTFKKHLKEHPEMYPDRVRAKVLEMEKEELEKEKAASAAAAKAKQEAENAQYDDDEYADDKAEGIVYKNPPNKNKNNNNNKPPVFLQKIAEKYNDDDLLAIDTVQFLFAVVFFILSTLLAIQICLWTGHIDKGELDN